MAAMANMPPYKAWKLHNFISITNCTEAHVREQNITQSQFVKVMRYLRALTEIKFLAIVSKF